MATAKKTVKRKAAAKPGKLHEPRVQRMEDQRWLVDATIRSVGVEWDQPRLNSYGTACGPLASGDLAGAGLDVFEQEPRVNPKLLKNPNAVLLPHMGSATVEARVEMGEKVIINIKVWMYGEKPPDRVLPQML